MTILAVMLGVSTVLAAAEDRTVISKEGRFSITWPDQPTEETRKLSSARGDVTNHFFHLDRADAQYSVQYDDFAKLDPKKIDVQKSLDATIDAFAKEKYYHVLSRKPIRLGETPGREIEFEIRGDKLPMGNRGRARAYIEKGRFYQVILVGTEVSKSAKADAFFDSFKILSGSNGPNSRESPKPWEPYTSAVGRFSVMMPAGTTEVKTSVDADAGARNLLVYQSGEGYMKYVVTVVDVDAASIASPKALLDETRDLVVKSAKGKLLSEKKVVVSRSPGREIKAEIPMNDDPSGGFVTCRIYLVKNRVYQVMAVGPRDQKDAKEAIETFFQSFRPSSAR